ncbi:hypothetical protein JX266_013994 [Neoarthrinium moseri]|nr:hypothetical protein JX266_013994 [Neoarthrinium moseri]
MSSYPPFPLNNIHGGYEQMMPNTYPRSHQGNGKSASMMPQSSVTQPHPQPFAPAPATHPPVLRTRAAGGEADQRTQIIGSRGHCAILPSAAGRPVTRTGAGAGKSTVIAQKDADGKFPCPQCTKTYLHAKHLKRHLLRRTGDRPYLASHLSRLPAHQAAQAKSAAESRLNQINGMSSMQGNCKQGDNVVRAFGLASMCDGMPKTAIGVMSALCEHHSRLYQREWYPDAPLIERQGELNAWDNAGFREAVIAANKSQIIVGGITTDVCKSGVAFLALSLREAGYSVWANVEASGTTTELIRDTANDQMRYAGVNVILLFPIVSELMRDWRHTQGAKQIFPYLDQYYPVYGSLARAHRGAVNNGTVVPGEADLP